MSANNASSKPKLTFDEFFDYVCFSSLTLSPDNNQSILIQSKHHVWDQNVNEEHLYQYSLINNVRKLVTRNASKSFRPLFKGEWIAYMTEKTSNLSVDEQDTYINLYSTKSEQTYPISVGKEAVHAFTWSSTTNILYFAAQSSLTDGDKKSYENEWKDVIEYRENERGDIIYRLNIIDMANIHIEAVVKVPLCVSEMICSFDGKRLVFSTSAISQQVESLDDFEIYSYDLIECSSSTPVRLTKNQAIERNLKWYSEETILFTVDNEGSVEDDYCEYQERLYSLNIINGHINRWAEQFTGAIKDFAVLEEGRKGIIILGQLNTEIQVYTQESPSCPLTKLSSLNGTYENLVTNFVDNKSTIAFIHSSFNAPQEVYFSNDMQQLTTAKRVTDENKLFTERSLPQGSVYRWTNIDDGTDIEGILLYPPDKYQEQKLPLFVLMHGGPYSADLNAFRADWYYIGVMIATEGWLVFQPNYRGSTGYGDQFIRDIVPEMISRPGKDILFGVDALIQDGIADPERLAVGGYSYGGHLTNWLITQTTRFNAALSGAGVVDHVHAWGLTDLPFFRTYKLGGYPWQVPDQFRQESAVFQLGKVKTPTHIVTGEKDSRVPTQQAYLLKRSLHLSGVPSKLIIFPGEEHIIDKNPWHEKIKLREELKWLKKYGMNRSSLSDVPTI